MILSSVFESALVKANMMLNNNQTNSKKNNKAVVNEIVKMCEFFGEEFEKNIYKCILEELEYKDYKSPLNSNKISKVQYLLQEFNNLLDKENFVDYFASILDITKLSTHNKVNSFEFFECISKILKLNIENQLKIILSMNLSNNSIFKNNNEAAKVLANKCYEIEKEFEHKFDINTLQNLLILAQDNCKEDCKFIEILNYDIHKKMFNNFEESQNFLNNEYAKSYNYSKFNNANNSNYNMEITSLNNLQNYNYNLYNNENNENILNNNNNNDEIQDRTCLDSLYMVEETLELYNIIDSKINVENIFSDLGPTLINNSISLDGENSNCSNSESISILNFELTESRLANFILYLINNQHFNEEKEIRIQNKIFLNILNNDLASSIDDTSDKRLQVGWNLESYYKLMKKYIDKLDQSKVIGYLDNENLIIKDKKSFEFLLLILNKLKFNKNTINKLLFELIFKKVWKNKDKQIEIINFMIYNNIHDIFPFRNECSFDYNNYRKLIYNNNLVNSNNKYPLHNSLNYVHNNYNQATINHIIDCFSCSEIVKILLDLSLEGNYYLKVKEIFDWPINYIPEILIITLSDIKIFNKEEESNEALYNINNNLYYMAIDIIKKTFPLDYNMQSNINTFEQLTNKNFSYFLHCISLVFEISLDESINQIQNFIQKNKKIIETKLIDFSKESNKNIVNSCNYIIIQRQVLLNNIVELTYKSNSLNKLLNESNDFELIIPLALLAVKKNYLNLEKWINQQIDNFGENFVISLVNYIEQNVLNVYKFCNENNSCINSNNIKEEPYKIFEKKDTMQIKLLKENILETSFLNLENLAIIFSCLSSESLSSKNILSIDILDNVSNSKKFKYNSNYNNNNNNSKSKTNSEKSFKKNLLKILNDKIENIYKDIFEIFDELYVQSSNCNEVELKINNIFDQYFNNEIQLPELINLLKEYKNSRSILETEVFAVFIFSILDEYKFVNSYPETQLKMFASLYGQIINNLLLDEIIEDIALRYVLSALESYSLINNNDNSTCLDFNLFIFACIAIEQFLGRLYNADNSNNNNINNFILKFNKINLKQELFNNSNYSSYYNIIIKAGERRKDSNTKKFLCTKSNNIINTSTNNSIATNIQNSINSNKYIPYNSNNFNSNNRNSQLNNLINNNIQASYGYDQSYYTNPESFNNFKNINNTNNNNNLINQSQKSALDQTAEIDQISNIESKNIQLSNTNEKNDQSKKILTNSISNTTNNANLSTTSNVPNRIKLQKNNLNLQNNITSEVLNEINYQPPIEILNKTKTIFFSLSKTNILEKANELKQILLISNNKKPNTAVSNNNNDNNNNTDPKQLLKWFSNYFIIYRAIQNNFHQVYNELINNIDCKELNNLLIKETIDNIKKLLNSEKIEEKQILKSLGSWLGIMTISKNKPLLFKDLDLKDLIFCNYNFSEFTISKTNNVNLNNKKSSTNTNNKLLIIINLICKILESAAKTKVFHSKNPWIMTLLYILGEVYYRNYSTMSLRFEIEGLFKKLDLDINIYSGKTKHLENYYNSLDIVNSNLNNSEAKFNDLYSQLILYNTFIEEITKMFINYIISLKVINSTKDITDNINKNDILNIICVSLQTAINEIIFSIEDRAITISFATAKEIVRKDFLFEDDENIFRNALINCIKSLSGSLAMVTCKEPLRSTFVNYLNENISKISQKFSSLVSLSNSSISIELENCHDIINKITSNQDILDIGYYFIQDIVIKRALEKLDKDKILHEEIDIRRKHNYVKNSPIFQKIANLPKNLKANIHHSLNLEENNTNKDKCDTKNDLIKVYNDFEKTFDLKKQFCSSPLNNNILSINNNSLRKDSHGNRISLLGLIVPALKEIIKEQSSYINNFTSNSNLNNNGLINNNNNNSKLLCSKLEICLTNIRTLTINNNNVNGVEYIECDESLYILSKIISESSFISTINNELSIECNKIENNNKFKQLSDQYNSLVSVCFKYIIKATKNKEYTLLNLYSEILKGFISINNNNCNAKEYITNIKKDITDRILFKDEDLILIRYSTQLNFYLLKKEIILCNQWEDHIIENLSNIALNKTIIKLIKELSLKGLFSLVNLDNSSNTDIEINTKYLYTSLLTNSKDSANNSNNKKNILKNINKYMIDNNISNAYFDMFYYYNNEDFNAKNPNLNIDLKLYYLIKNNKTLPSYTKNDLIDYKCLKVKEETFIKIKEFVKFNFEEFLLFFYDNKPLEIKKTIFKIFENNSEENIIPAVMFLTQSTLEYNINTDKGDSNTNSKYILPSLVANFIYKCIELSQITNKLELIENALLGIYKVLCIDYINNNKINNINLFNQKPYIKLLSNLIKLFFESKSDELFNLDKNNFSNTSSDKIRKYQVFIIISDFLKIINPNNFPGLSLAWIELISNSQLMSIMIHENSNLTNSKIEEKKLLLYKQESYAKLLCELLKFISLNNSNSIKSYYNKYLYDKIIKFFYLLSVTYSDFMISHYVMFITSLPVDSEIPKINNNINIYNLPNIDGFMQLKNIILSPSITNNPVYNTSSIDFFKEDFKIEHIPVITKTPIVNFDVSLKLKELNLKELIDDVLMTKNNNEKFDKLIIEFNKKENSAGKKKIINIIKSNYL